MIRLTKLNNESMFINADLIEFIEETPDTLISMTTGRKIMVRESVTQALALINRYKSATTHTEEESLM